MSEGEMYVDPEDLRYKARPYELAAREWEEVGVTLDGLRVRCWAIWGGDELGSKFRPSFDAGVDNVSQGVKGLGKTLLYHADGLVQNSEIYGQARDDADQGSYEFLNEFEGLGTPPPQRRLSPVRLSSRDDAVEPGQPLTLQRGVLIKGADALVPGQPISLRHGVVAQPETPGEPPVFMRSSRLAAQAPDLGTPAQYSEPEPMQQGRHVRERPAVTLATGANPPAGEYWSDGDWVYAKDTPPILLSKLDSPYAHGAPPITYEPGTIPPPAQGVVPPPGQLWHDGVYLYASDGAIRPIANLDSPYDHV